MSRSPRSNSDWTVPLSCRLVDGESAVHRRLEPVTCGIPWPPDFLRDDSGLVLVDHDGAVVPLQARVLERWPDDSVRWLLLDWLATTDGDRVYRVRPGAAQSPGSSVVPRLSVQTEKDPPAIIVDTGVTTFRVDRKGSFFFREVRTGKLDALDCGHSQLLATDDAGRKYVLAIDSLAVAESGPVRASIRFDGRLVTDSTPPLAAISATLHFFCHSSAVRFQIEISNPRAAGHPEGRWSLGSSGSVFLQDLSLMLTLPPDNRATLADMSIDRERPMEYLDLPLELYQDSSGGPNWRSRNHVNRDGVVPLQFRGYRLRAGDKTISGHRSTPLIRLQQGEREISVCLPRFWQDFPKSLEASSDSLVVRIFPRQFSDLHEIQGGEKKTHEFAVVFGPDGVAAEPLAWCRSPLFVHADPDWYSQAMAVPYLTPRAADPNSVYLDLVDAAIKGESSFENTRDSVDEFGWRHYGDIYANHEGANHEGEDLLISHYNNQYDAIWGMAVQFFRTGDSCWRRQMNDLAEHFEDIDIYHTDNDKAAYNRGPFWHTVHYVDAERSTHRAYPPVPGVLGGGPSPGNLNTTGLLIQYFLTGLPRFRQAVISLGQYVIDADDGNKTVFRYLDRGNTGHSTESGVDRYHGPGRTSANSISALLDAFRLSLDPVFLDKAEELIRRCIHPEDDLKARNLLDAENRWFYTMFLRTLAKYLEVKAEIGQLDRMYSYGRSALLHYARWAAEHEYPYLDKPEILEFPTETWAAQDMRKSEIFKLASIYCVAEQERQMFLQRARYFFDHCVQSLQELPTSGYCRPTVLMLTLGYSQAYFDRHPNLSAPEPTDEAPDFGQPQVFQTQKERVKKKALALGLGGLILLTLALLLFTYV